MHDIRFYARLSSILVVMVISTAACTQTSTSPSKHVDIAEPTYNDTINADPDWIASLLSEYADADTIRLERFVAANLDDDPANEYLMVIEPDSSTLHDHDPPQRFLVIDSTASRFNTLLNHKVWPVAGESPYIQVLNDSISFHQFCVAMYGSRGSGTVYNFLSTFRLSEGVVYRGPEIVVHAGLDMATEVISQDVEGEVSQTSTDSLIARFRYRFFPSYYVQDTLHRTAGCPEKPLSVIENSATVIYSWNDSQHEFIPNYFDGKLSDAKMECLTTLGVDDIFPTAFKSELDSIVRTGNECERAMAKYFLRGGRK